MSNNGKVTTNGAEPRYYTMIPNMIYDMGLSVYEIALYGNYRRTASEKGVGFKSNKTLAAECGMSERKVRETRKSLEEKGLITVEYPTKANGGNLPAHVKIVNIWEQNNARYDAPPMRHHMPPPAAPHAAYAAPHATKEDLNNKNKSKKGRAIAPAPTPPPEMLEKRKIVDGLGILSGRKSYDAFKEDLTEYTLEQFARAAAIFKQRIVETGNKPYAYFAAILSGLEGERQQSELIAKLTPVRPDTRRYVAPVDEAITDSDRKAVLDILKAMKKGDSDE